jgi:hypothetical protein
MLHNGYLTVPQGLILLWVLLVVVYRRIYNRNINKKLEGKKALNLVDPSRLNVISLIALLVIFNIITVIQAQKSIRSYENYQADRFLPSISTGNSFEELGESTMGGLYKDPESAGYLKETLEQNDFRYTVFKSPLYSDMMHADMIFCAEYTGDRKDLFTMFSTVKFRSPGGELISSYCYGNNPDRCVMILLACNQKCTVEISLDYLKDKEALDSIRNTGDFGEQIQNISEVHDSVELEWNH